MINIFLEHGMTVYMEADESNLVAAATISLYNS